MMRNASAEMRLRHMKAQAIIEGAIRKGFTSSAQFGWCWAFEAGLNHVVWSGPRSR